MFSISQLGGGGQGHQMHSVSQWEVDGKSNALHLPVGVGGESNAFRFPMGGGWEIKCAPFPKGRGGQMYSRKWSPRGTK